VYDFRGEKPLAISGVETRTIQPKLIAIPTAISQLQASVFYRQL
jgi:hypothetical protein